MMDQPFYKSSWRKKIETFWSQRPFIPAGWGRLLAFHNGQVVVDCVSLKGLSGRNFMAIGFVWALSNPWHVWEEKAFAPKAMTSIFLPTHCPGLDSLHYTQHLFGESTGKALGHIYSEDMQLRQSWVKAWTSLLTKLLRWRDLTWMEEFRKNTSAPWRGAGLALRVSGERMLVAILALTGPSPSLW